MFPNQQNALKTLRRAYRHIHDRTRREYVPIADVIADIQQSAGSASAESVRKLIFDLRKAYPDQIRIDRQRGVADDVLWMRS